MNIIHMWEEKKIQNEYYTFRMWKDNKNELLVKLNTYNSNSSREYFHFIYVCVMDGGDNDSLLFFYGFWKVWKEKWYKNWNIKTLKLSIQSNKNVAMISLNSCHFTLHIYAMYLCFLGRQVLTYVKTT